MKKPSKTYLILSILCAVVLLTIVLFLCLWNGIILLNNPDTKNYPVRGFDVSSYHGLIDWQTLSQQDLSFAFIKATEGSSFVDSRFEYNYAEAQKTHLRVGAYHFFSFDSLGQTQADNFIRTVKKADNMLPPVVDVEFYGNKASNPPDANKVRAQLSILLDALEAHYGLKPIIYATADTYSLYLEGHYNSYDIWFRNVFSAAELPDGRDWTFWQYTNRARLDGYNGPEKFIDMNVFYGSVDEFERYAK